MAKDSIVIIDYGSGNLRSAEKAFARVIAQEGLNMDVKVSSRAEDVLSASRIVLPGQGAFGDCINGLSSLAGMREALEEAVIKKGKPFLGICVGMQLMATWGLEHGKHKGLGWIPGEVVEMKPTDPRLKIPHMGWNELIPPVSGDSSESSFVLRNNGLTNHYYFVHSFMFQCEYKHHILGFVEYGGLVPAIVGRDNMVGVQFHPEKSQDAGLGLISDFLKWNV
jgi:glutamine amidotransferase